MTRGWSWPGWEQLRKLRHALGATDARERITFTLDFAPLGTSERVLQVKELRDTFQEMVRDAARAHRDRLRPSS